MSASRNTFYCLTQRPNVYSTIRLIEIQTDHDYCCCFLYCHNFGHSAQKVFFLCNIIVIVSHAAQSRKTQSFIKFACIVSVTLLFTRQYCQPRRYKHLNCPIHRHFLNRKFEVTCSKPKHCSFNRWYCWGVVWPAAKCKGNQLFKCTNVPCL